MPSAGGWVNSNAYTSFATLMSLTTLTDWTFESAHPAYSPGNFTRAFGGHVFAQSVLAAGRTVRKGMFVHSITGHFLQLGYTDKPFTYTVSVARDGGGYVQRRVEVTQEGTKGVMFTAVVSFKRPEESANERSRQADLERRYEGLLDGRKPESWPEVPGIDSPYWWEVEKKYGVDKFPGLEMRKVDMDRYNRHRKTLDRRQLMYYRVIGEMPSVTEDPNLHAAAHLYASDRNGLFPIANFLNMGNAYSAIASLNHTVIFHYEPEGFSMLDERGKAKWFCVEESIDHIAHGRGLAMMKLWDVAGGKPIATAMQDGMLRFQEGVEQSLDAKDFIFAKKTKL